MAGGFLEMTGEELALIAFGLTALLFTGGLLLLLWRRPWRGPRTRYPVVLVHGLFGFSEIVAGPLKRDYFSGIVPHLRGRGVEVTTPKLPPVAAVAARARALAEHVRSLPARKVNIIAHSMGGLDARYAISKLGLGDRVASLVTIGTPHRGTPVADAGMAVLGAKVGLGPLLAAVGLKAFLDLTEQSAQAFNAQVRDVRGVFYATAITSIERDDEPLHPLLRLTHRFLASRDLRSDGMVPVESQRWGRVLARVRADHWAQIGWTGELDAAAFYVRLLRQLRARRF